MAVELPEQDLEIVDGDLITPATPGENEELVDLDTAQPQITAQPAAQPTPAATPNEDDELPEALRGKSPKEIARLYRDAQQHIGRQASEMGELRKAADLALRTTATLAARQAAPAPAAAPAAPAAPATPDEVEFFKTPAEAVAKMIANHPAIKRIEETLGNTAKNQAVERATRATERFNSAHPDAATILQDPEFRQWVGASRVRSALLNRAHHQFDFDAGDEVFGTWKALKGIGRPGAAAPAAPAQADVSAAARTLAAQKKRAAALNDAATPTGGNGTASNKGAVKIYRRTDVIRLMETNPDRYLELAPEIELAYKEGRVR